MKRVNFFKKYIIFSSIYMWKFPGIRMWDVVSYFSSFYLGEPIEVSPTHEPIVRINHYL